MTHRDWCIETHQELCSECYIIGMVLGATSLVWYWYLLCICMSDCIHVTLCADRLSPAPVVSLHQKKTVFISCGAEHTAVLTKVKGYFIVSVCAGCICIYVCVLLTYRIGKTFHVFLCLGWFSVYMWIRTLWPAGAQLSPR